MVKLKLDPIREKDLIEFLDNYSDFSFELSVLKMLRENGLECEHGGLYEDPVTEKSREFDIRAMSTIDNYRVRLSIECKNIRDNFPILISCIPRHEDESYHHVVYVSEPGNKAPFLTLNIPRSRPKTFNIRGTYSVYKPSELVGKSTDQVGRTVKGHITAHDNELFDKWSQCLNSANDLVERIHSVDKLEKDVYFLSSVFPVLVIPNNRLWVVEYDNDGKKISDPYKTDRCSCFADKSYSRGILMRISHIEIMTYDGLNEFVNSYLKTEAGISIIYSNDGICESFEREIKK